MWTLSQAKIFSSIFPITPFKLKLKNRDVVSEYA